MNTFELLDKVKRRYLYCYFEITNKRFLSAKTPKNEFGIHSLSVKKKNSVSKKKKTKKKKTFLIKIEELQYKNHLKTKFFTLNAFISASKAEDKLGSQCSHSEAPYILMIVSNQTENIWSIT